MKIRISLTLALLALSSCQGASLITEELDADASASEEGTVTVTVVHKGTAEIDGELPELDPGDGTRQFLNDAGLTITLTRAAVSWGHLQLISDGDDEECEDGHTATLHLESIENLLDADASELRLGAETVAIESYCHYVVELAPDNSESPGIEDFAEIAGGSVYAEGTWSDGVTTMPFAVKIEDAIEVNNAFTGSGGSPHPFHFHEGETAKTLRLANVYDRWFDGVDFSETDDELAAEIAANVAANLGQHFVTTH